MKKLSIAALIIIFMAISFSSRAEEGTTPTGPATEKPQHHLFILSGQSNMYHMKSETFNATVEKAFGKDNVIIARNAKRGAPILLWDKDYKWPEGTPIPQGRARPDRKPRTKEEFEAEFGSLYDALMEAVKKQTEGKTYDTVTFCWMQGESDSKPERVEQYFESFNRIIERLKSDLKISSINIVIGRLSDYGLDGDNPGWNKMRELQVKYAEENKNCAWINTDDLNDIEKNGEMQNGLHYSEKGYDTLGIRFAEKAIALIQNK